MWTGPVFGIDPVVILKADDKAADGNQQRAAAVASSPDVWYIEYLYPGVGETAEYLGVRSRIQADYISPCAPLSAAERAEWISLVQRLRY
jgi:hypothetical protein